MTEIQSSIFDFRYRDFFTLLLYSCGSLPPVLFVSARPLLQLSANQNTSNSRGTRYSSSCGPGTCSGAPRTSCKPSPTLCYCRSVGSSSREHNKKSSTWARKIPNSVSPSHVHYRQILWHSELIINKMVELI